MIKQMTKIGKIQFTVLVPESIDEFDKAHGRAGAVLEKGINYDVAHTILGKIRSKAGEALVKLGAKRDVEKTNPDGTKVYKPIDTKWIDRQFVALNIGPAEQAVFYQGIADEVGYDVTGSRSSNKDFNQVDLKDAKNLLEAIKLGKSTVERVKSNLEARNAGLVVVLEEDGTITEESLAAALKVERARVEAERQSALL